MVAFAASKGYTFTADEVREHAKAKAKAAGRELTDAELDGVAVGGKDSPTERFIVILSEGSVPLD